MLGLLIFLFVIYWVFNIWFPKYKLEKRYLFGKLKYRIYRRNFCSTLQLFDYEDVGESFDNFEDAHEALMNYIIHNL